MTQPLQATPDQVSALMLRLPEEARSSQSGFIYDEDGLHVPDDYVEAVETIMAAPGWDTPPAVVETDPTQKLVAFLSENPDVRALIGA